MNLFSRAWRGFVAERAQEKPAIARRASASWKLLVAILLIAIGTALAALAAIRSILGLLEGMVS